jgi:hypothetical protein
MPSEKQLKVESRKSKGAMPRHPCLQRGLAQSSPGMAREEYHFRL